MAKGYAFDGGSARRIDRVVRRVERMPVAKPDLLDPSGTPIPFLFRRFELKDALEEELASLKCNVDIKPVGCVGMCHRTPLVEVPEDRFGEGFEARWGGIYLIDAMMEHAVMHPIRHTFQLRELMSRG